VRIEEGMGTRGSKIRGSTVDVLINRLLGNGGEIREGNQSEGENWENKDGWIASRGGSKSGCQGIR
jgi:hypothetical protein